MRILLSLFLALSFLKANEVLALHLLPHKHVNKSKNTQTSTHHGRGAKKMYSLVGFDDSFKNTDVTYITATLEEKKVDIQNKMIIPPRSGIDNYHVIVANASKENNFYTAVYYKYERGKPSKTSPKKLTLKPKGIFEIIPDPLPREHDRYYASKKYQFILHFNGKVLQKHIIGLSTLNDTTTIYTTDKEGKFEIVLPNDFKDVKTSKRGNTPSYFILSAHIENESNNYYTTFSNPYNVNPHDYWSSTSSGAIVVVIGLLIGLLILWRIKNG